MLRPMKVSLLVFVPVLFLAHSAGAVCPAGDVHHDCQVNWLDVARLAEYWLDPGCSAPDCRADLDGVPGVNMADFAFLAQNWLTNGTFTLVINEFMADNEGTIEDPDDPGDFPDWIEIYNYGDDPVDIGGMYISDRLLGLGSDWGRYWIPDNYSEKTTILAGGFLLIWADGDPGDGPLHTDFGLSAGGNEWVALYDAYRNPIDSVWFDAQNDDESRGRLPDANDHWEDFELGRTTPGKPNRREPVRVMINEIMYHPYHGPNEGENMGQEYIELFNNGGEPVSLEGWRFSDGVDFVFPDGVELGSGGYLVVASDVNAFETKYPGVTNVIGGWEGRLSNSGEEIELVDNAGVIVDRIRYADQGEWVQRLLGPVERGHRGWVWSEAHDGDGESLELINPALPNECGQNFSAGNTGQGTPGELNTVYHSDIAPLIVDAEHTPIIPGPNDPVTVTARIIDELTTGVTATLHYRVDTSSYRDGDEDIYPHHDPNDYNDLPVFDDGAHGDGDPCDGVYGAKIPAQPDGTIIEFYVEASDAGANSRTWPAPSLIDGVPEQVTNALYQVDESFDPDTWTAGTQPTYYLIMTENEKDRLEDIVRNHSSSEGPNSQMNATFVSVDGVEVKVRYNVAVRNRGHGTRRNWPNNYRVNFAHDRSWEDITAINLNTVYTYLQLAGNALFQMSGMAQCDAAAVQVRTNGENLALVGSSEQRYGSYVHVEMVDTDFADNHFPDDDGGNAYKGMRISGDHANLRYEEAIADEDHYTHHYFKQTNVSEYDWSDLIGLTYALSDNTPDANYVEEVSRVLNAEQWLRFLAINALLDNSETTLANGSGDDYYIYRGIADQRFVLIQHDLDSIFGLGQDAGSVTSGIFRAARIPALNRFLKHPDFVPRYYFHLKDLIETTFSAEQLGPFLDELLGDFVPAGTIQQMKDFVAQRNAHVLSLIPSDLTIVSDLPQSSGYYVTDVNVAVLYGTADAIETRSVLVNGKPANWLPVDGEWDVIEPQEADYEIIVDRGSSWKYFDEYTDLGPDWYIDLNDSSWPEGDAELGYGDTGDRRPEATTIGYIDTDPCTPAIEKNFTTYFTHRFDVNDVSIYSGLSLRILRDDGALVYLNGVEIARSNMPQGEIGYNTPASTNVYGNDADDRDMETLYYGGGTYANDDDFTNIDFSLLENGTNVLAVEIHQFQINGADTSFDLKLRGWLKDAAPPIGVSLNPGINRIIVETFDGPDGTGSELDSAYIDIWYDDGDVTGISGTLAVDTILDAASGPWHVTGDIVVPSGVTLTIEPETTLFFNAGAGITVQNGGRLVAQGTEYRRIRLTSVPGGSHWDGVKFDRTLQDNRLAYLDHEFGDAQGESTDVQHSRVTIDNMTWSGTDTQVLNIDHPSVICRNSVFPSISSTEPLHGVGLTGDEYIIFDGCIFGTAESYNDIIDFRDAQRPGPIFQLYNSIFLGGGDDGLDIDSTDAHVEGNVFMNFHGGGGGGTSSAVATGVDGGDPTEVYVARNIFINNDHAVLLKEDCFLYAQNNVFLGSDIAVVIFGEPYRDPPRTPGKGAVMEGNIFWNNAAMFEHFFQEPLPTYGPTGEVIVDNSILPVEWHYLGLGNIDADPIFVDEQGGDFRLKPGSGAIGAGSWGLDMGALVPAGAAISGEPYAVTYRTDAILTVGGPGITHYKYSVNAANGPWSAEMSVDVPIELTGLVDGQSYTVYAIGKNSAGVRQSEDAPAASRTWTIDVSHSELLINEVLAHSHGVEPDIIELYYDGPESIDLTGMSLTDDPLDPDKFVFSTQSVLTTTMSPGDYMILYGDPTTAKNHLGFALRAEGEGLYLYDKDGDEFILIDSVEFGQQINDFSIGRVGYDRAWKLNSPTFVPPNINIVQPLGDPETLKINEWLANGRVLFDDDFIELYNPHPLPVDLSGMYLTDNPVTQPAKHKIVPLSFIGPEGYAVFRANDGNDPWEVDFKLSADGEMIGLFDGGLNMIDQVMYGPQTTDVSQGRAPDGSANYEFFELPTPGVANTFGSVIVTVSTLVPEDADKWARVPISAEDVNDTWKSDPDFDNSGWLACTGGPGGVGYERGSGGDYDGLITLDVEAQMYNKNTTCYIRIPFIVDGAELVEYTGMTLKMRYDDGFVAYINGVKLDIDPAICNFTGTPAWDSQASTGHEADGASFDANIDISGYISDLRAGNNVLAIHGLNRPVGSSDFVISAELDVTTTTLDEDFPFLDDLDVLAGLRITEMMYHARFGSNFDYIELQNISDIPLKLDRVRFTDGIELVFGDMQLDPSQYVVVVRNLAAFRSAYGYSANVAGVYINDLSNGGEDIVLQLAWPLEAAVMRFDYSDRWYPSTDGGGQSLEIIDPTAHPATWNDAESWRAAAPSPATP